MPYQIDIYRLGWYQGLGGRLMLSITDQAGHAQGYYDATNKQLIGCKSCRVDTKTGLVEANWQPSYRLTIPPDWTTGIYLAKFTSADGMQSYAPFDVLGNPHSAYVAVTPDTTYAAYNNWGGFSLYESEKSTAPTGENDPTAKGVKVSFDRPYAQVFGSSQVLVFEIDAIRWMERQGYDFSYISDIDLDMNPTQLLNHKAYLSLGHDEYWTKNMRDGVVYARDRGVGLAFLGSNAIYWQMRLEKDSQGNPNRTVVCYKIETVLNDLARDPIFGKDNTLLTTEWRDPALSLPENQIIGVMFDNLTHNVPGFPWKVSTPVNSPLLEGTGLQAGVEYGCNLVGYEWDRVFNNGYTPYKLHVIATSKTVNDDGKDSTSNTTYYIAPSGAFVFATGSIYWTTALDNYRFQDDSSCIDRGRVVSGIQQLMANVMDALLVHHASQ